MNGKIYAVMMPAGGVGKTTTATTTAVGLARKFPDKRFLIVDMDSQGDTATTMLGLKTNGRCVSKVIDRSYVSNGQVDLVAAYRANIMSASQPSGVKRPNLHVLPSSDRITQATMGLINEASDTVREMVTNGTISSQPIPTVVSLFTERLMPLRRIYDVIIFDCPPSSGILEKAIFSVVDEIIAPINLDYKSLRATLLLIKRIEEARKEGIVCRVSWMVPTQVDLRTNLAQNMLKNLEQKYSSLLTISEAIPRTVNLTELPARGGLTIHEHIEKLGGSPSHVATAAAEAYQALIDGIAADVAAAEASEVAYA